MSLLKLRNISKMFYGVQVLHEINLELRAGEVHALVGENGAGKSTLVNIVAGVHELTSGEIYVDNRKVHIKSPYHAKKLGISIVYQEPCLIPDMTIAENIFIGAQPSFLGIFSNYMNMKKEIQGAVEIAREPSSSGCACPVSFPGRPVSCSDRPGSRA